MPHHKPQLAQGKRRKRKDAKPDIDADAALLLHPGRSRYCPLDKPMRRLDRIRIVPQLPDLGTDILVNAIDIPRRLLGAVRLPG